MVLIDEEITKACLALKISEADEDVLVLRHMVLAHHGLLEYGSPVRPRIMEAEVLHQIDNDRCFNANDADFDSSNRARKIHRSNFRYGQS